MQAPIKDAESREVGLGPDPLSAALRGEMRVLVERLIREELVAALGAEPCERTPERRGNPHSPRERTITAGLGPVTLTHGRLFAAAADGSEEWQSHLLPRYPNFRSWSTLRAIFGGSAPASDCERVPARANCHVVPTYPLAERFLAAG